MAALDRLGKNYAPEFIYFKTLYELLKDKIDAQLDSDQRLRDNHLYDTAIWKALYAFQKDGVKSIVARLQQHNGCILADSVGLGKTYTALAVIKYYELRNERVLVLCPNKLRQNWELYPIHRGHSANPFTEDRFSYITLSHTDLSRERGSSGGIDLANFNWGAFDLIVIDESHNFRNAEGNRYRRLLDEVIREGARTKVLMLSATPVNTSLIDLRNQVYLMTEKSESHFRESLGVGNVGSVMAVAQRAFKQWEGEQSKHGKRDKTQLLERLGPDFLRLLDGVSISRSRRQITQFYAEEMERIGQFPAHAPPDNAYPPTDLLGELSYEYLAEQIKQFTLSIYRPSDYLADAGRQAELVVERAERNFNQQDREHYLVGMMRVNFLKRLESSPHSLTLTLRRTIAKMDALLGRIAAYQLFGLERDDLGDNLPDEDEDDEDFLVNHARRPYHLGELDLPRWEADIRWDKDALDAALAKVAAITPERDGKVREIREAVRRKAQEAPADRDGKPKPQDACVHPLSKIPPNTCTSTLRVSPASSGLRMAMVSGDNTRTAYGRNDFNSILTNFAPAARKRGDERR